MSGRPKLKVHEYDLSGKFIKTFLSQADFRAEYYDTDLGKRPLFQEQDFIILFDRVFTCDKIGRKAVQYIVKRNGNVFLSLGNSPREIECLNMDNVIIASFASIKIAGDLTKIPFGTIYSSVTVGRKHGVEGLLFRYKK